MKEAYYFSHDYHARADANIVRLLRVNGVAGYGIFWMIVEMLYESGGSIPHDYEMLSYEMRTQCDCIKSVCEDYDLFYFEDDKIHSKSVDRRIAERENRSNTARSSAMKRWDNNAKAMPMQCDGNAIKERKGKERKEKGGGETDPPTLSEVREYRESEHLKADPEKFHAWQASKGWAGVIDWQAAFRYWDKTEYPDKIGTVAPKAGINPADTHIKAMAKVDLINAWHDKHMAGGKCAFCGEKGFGLAPCGCAKYQKLFSEFTNSTEANHGT